MLNKTYLRLFAACVITSFTHGETNAQSITTYASDNGYTFRSLDKFVKNNFVNTYKTELGLTCHDTLKEKDFDVDSLGNFNARYTQTYKGYEVEGASLTLHGSEGVVLSANKSLLSQLNVSVNSPISESQALAYAIDSIGEHDYPWEDSTTEALLKEFKEDANATYLPKGELLISRPQYVENLPENYKLYWKFFIEYTDSPGKNQYVYVNALNGVVESIFDATNYGSFGVGYVETTHNGWMPFRTFKCNLCSDWRLEGDNIKTKRLFKNFLNKQQYSWIKDDDNSWNQIDERRVAGTTHWAAQKAKEYYISRHRRVGVDGKDGVLEIAVYAPEEYASQKTIAGASKAYGLRFPMPVGLHHTGVLDIMGHEFTHLVIDHTSNLNPRGEDIEAAILNEGFCDIMGLDIESYMVGSAHGWKMGEQITSPYPYVNIRDFSNPHISTELQPKKYMEAGYWLPPNSGQDYRHVNNGVLLYWFYLLTNGGTANGYTVSGIGMKGASDLAYIVMANRLNSKSDFAEARNESVKLAIEWWGECSFLYQQVVKAWMAVGVGNMVYCKKYQLYGKDVLPTKNVGGVIKPAMGKGPFKISAANEATATPQSISWVIPESWNVTYDGDNMGFTLNSISSTASQWVTAYVTENNVTDTLKHFVHFVECDSPYCIGTSENKSSNGIESIFNNSNKKANVYPNPANNGYISIELPVNIEGGKTIMVRNLQGVTIKTLTINHNFTTINISDIPAGIYTISISGDNVSETHKVIINSK